MRRAALASVAIHFGLIAGAWGFLQFAPAEDTGAESVSVDIISMDAVSTEPSEMITETNWTLVSAGSEFESMEVPEVAAVELDAAEPVEVAEPLEIAEAKPVEASETKSVEVAKADRVEVAESDTPDVAKAVSPAAAEPTEDIASATVMAAVAETIAPVEGVIPQQIDEAAVAVADSVAPSESDPLEAVRTASIGELTPEPPIQQMPAALVKPAEAVTPVETASLAPVVEQEAEAVPVPKPRIVRKPVEAKVEPAKEAPKTPPKKPETPKKTPAREQPKKAQAPSKQANLGNGGAADADTAANKKSGGGQGKRDDGGSAAASKYPGLVHAKVTRAAKYPAKAKGKGGEALVSFTVAAGGNVSRVALVRSSGNAALDDAALAAVNRAAPFPPIPAAAGRSSWAFTVPVYFKK